MARFAAIGDDGRRPVVWGVGDTVEQADEDAYDNLERSECTSEIQIIEVSEERYARIVGGDVDASDIVGGAP
jgi:hypothetical protein